MGYIIEPIPTTNFTGEFVTFSNLSGILNVGIIESGYFKIFTISNQQFYLYTNIIQIGITNNIVYTPISFTMTFNTLTTLALSTNLLQQFSCIGTNTTTSTAICEIGSIKFYSNTPGVVDFYAMVRNDTANFRFSTQFLFNLQ